MLGTARDTCGKFVCLLVCWVLGCADSKGHFAPITSSRSLDLTPLVRYILSYNGRTQNVGHVWLGILYRIFMQSQLRDRFAGQHVVLPVNKTGETERFNSYITQI